MTEEQLSQNTAAVADLADHMQRLQQRAQSFAESFGASQRGYFTPTEDEQARQLLVSYWQARIALLELIQACRQELDGHVKHDPRVFLIAYAAVLILIDAARFMRDLFDDRPIVRAKLNEPEPSFGIPADAYDTVQYSLTSLRNAWHIYHANEHLAEQRDALRALVTADARLLPCWRVVETLGHRTQVSKSRYAKAKLQVGAELLAHSLRYAARDRLMYSVQELVSSLIADVHTVPGHQPALPEPITKALYEVLQPGDVIIVRKEHAVTNYFLPGYWPHAALYVGRPDDLQALRLHEHPHVQPRWRRMIELDPAEPRRVVEAMKDGVRLRPISQTFKSDAVTVIRPTLPRECIVEALARGFFHEGKPYDFDFDLSRSDRLVCTEVVYRAYEGIGDTRFELTRRVGRLTLSAEDLLRMAVNGRVFKPVAAYAPGHTACLAQGDDANQVLCKTISMQQNG